MQSLIQRWRSLSYALIPLIPAAVTTFVLALLTVSPSFGATVSRTSTVPAAVARETADGPSARPRAGGPTRVLGGLTSGDWPAIVAVSGDGRAIKTAVIAVDLRCTDGEQFTFADPWLLVPVKSNGSFRASFHDSSTEQGATIEISDSFAGKLNHKRTRLSAKLQLQMTVHEPDGTSVSCDSGTVSLRARD